MYRLRISGLSPKFKSRHTAVYLLKKWYGGYGYILQIIHPFAVGIG